MPSVTHLGSTVKEENSVRKEFYTAEWQSLTMAIRPWEGCTVQEADRRRRESYDRRHQVAYLIQRSPNGIMGLGRVGERLREYRVPYQHGLPVPIFKPTHISPKVERADTPPVLKDIMELERALGSDGSCPDKREISQITRELPPVIQPVKLDAQKSGLAFRSLSRSMSHEAQRG
uniref:Telethonin n=1 Tax=Callorhinchus milii TaxID=7868 RepID=V9L736_CALMI